MRIHASAEMYINQDVDVSVMSMVVAYEMVFDFIVSKRMITVTDG